jgi:hypothetical protein
MAVQGQAVDANGMVSNAHTALTMPMCTPVSLLHWILNMTLARVAQSLLPLSN